MKKIYLDATQDTRCMDLFVKDMEVVRTGTTIYTMSVKDRNEVYLRYAQDYDIHFIFEDHVPNITFYTIPYIDIMAEDNEGGFIGSIGMCSDLESNAPICYINKDLECFLVADNMKVFLEKADSWKNHLEPYKDIVFYKSKSEAEQEIEIIDSRQICIKEEYFDEEKK